MKIISLREYQDVYNLCDMWNQEFGFIFPISKDLFKKNVLDYKPDVLDISFVSILDNKVVGFVIGKMWDNVEIPTYIDSGWVSLIYVLPEFRRQGIGSLLLDKVEEIFVSQNKTEIFLGKDYLNFFPGLPVDLKHHKNWFEKRGYEWGFDTNDLIKRIDGKTSKFDIKPGEYRIKRAEIENLDSLGNLLKTNWPGRWYKEYLDYVTSGGTGYEYMVALNKENQVVGFCKVCNDKTKTSLTSYSLNYKGRFTHLGGIGPLGVDINYRKRGIAGSLIKGCINDLIDENITDIIIDWTNLMYIYNKYGFEIWKSYSYMKKKIK